MDIIFQNDSLIAADKPHGWLSVPGRFAHDERPCLGLQLQKELGRQIFPVHRLDFEVSGLVLFTFTPEAHRIAQSWFEFGVVSRTYEALSGPLSQAQSKLVEDWQVWESKLVKGKRRTFEAEYGKPSITRARAIEKQELHTRWELSPITGRSHQLRFEMNKHGHPILGDKLYGGSEWRGEDEIALRAVTLNFAKCENPLGLPITLSVTSL